MDEITYKFTFNKRNFTTCPFERICNMYALMPELSLVFI